MLEFPEANLDDYGPKALDAFINHMGDRAKVERTWEIFNEAGYPSGIVAFLPITPRLGQLHGILFKRGSMLPDHKREALRAIIEELFADGIEKIVAAHFATNRLIGPFLRDLGFRREGYLAAHTLQGGKPLDMVQLALLRK